MKCFFAFFSLLGVCSSETDSRVICINDTLAADFSNIYLVLIRSFFIFPPERGGVEMLGSELTVVCGTCWSKQWKFLWPSLTSASRLQHLFNKVQRQSLCLFICAPSASSRHLWDSKESGCGAHRKRSEARERNSSELQLQHHIHPRELRNYSTALSAENSIYLCKKSLGEI